MECGPEVKADQNNMGHNQNAEQNLNLKRANGSLENVAKF
jgi:hypothetical protein